MVNPQSTVPEEMGGGITAENDSCLKQFNVPETHNMKIIRLPLRITITITK